MHKHTLKFNRAVFNESIARTFVEREPKGWTQEIAQASSDVIAETMRQLRLSEPRANPFEHFVRASQAHPACAAIVFSVFKNGSVTPEYLLADAGIEVEG